MKPMEPMKPMAPMAPMKPMQPMKPVEPWWPSQLGSPDSTGSQNATRYAYFADAHRLVVERNGKVQTYDTGSKRIRGFGQQQRASGSLEFETDAGRVEVGSLRSVD